METSVPANDWHDPRWRAAAEQWMTASLDRLGTPVTGPVELVRAVPWSVTLRAPTAAGMRWFKANTMDCAYEAALAEALGRWVPGRVLTPVAVDTTRGWMLTADAGRTVRENGGDRLPAWEGLLVAYGRMQRELAAQAAPMVVLGVPDLRPGLMPGHLAALLAEPHVRAGLGPARAAAVQAATPAYHRWCVELDADPVPASLQHDDLHDGNVFPSGAGYLFFDWGDASVAHPFGTLLVALGSARRRLGLDSGAVARLRDAYLSVWSDLAPPGQLRRSAELACRVGPVSRALSWRRALRDAAVPVDAQVRTSVADWLAELYTTSA